MKRRILVVIVGVLLLIGSCTIISAKNYVKDLAWVTVTSTVQNYLWVEVTVSGELYYQEVVDVVIPAGCYVKEVFAETGDALVAGSPLIQLDEPELQITCLQKQLQLQELERVQRAGGTEGELASWQIKRLKKEIDSLKTIIENDGVIRTEASSYVVRQGYKKGDQTTKDSLIELGLKEEGCYLEWSVSSKEYRKFTSGTATVQGKKIPLVWDNPKYENGDYIFRMEISDMTACIPGEQVEIQLSYMSEEEYKAVLPKGCIHYDKAGFAYVYEVATRNTNFGKESYVRKRGVTIEDQDDENVVVKAALSGVVLRSSKELSEMAVVVVVEE